ncbi:MAG: hypothetical protein AAFP69_16335, partial [Planctomycetota bacterium]
MTGLLHLETSVLVLMGLACAFLSINRVIALLRWRVTQSSTTRMTQGANDLLSWGQHLSFVGFAAVLSLSLGAVIYGTIFAVLVVSVYLQSVFARYRNECRQWNDSIGILINNRASIIDAADAFAFHRPTTLSNRLWHFANMVRRGIPVRDAIVASRVPFDLASTMLVCGELSYDPQDHDEERDAKSVFPQNSEQVSQSTAAIRRVAEMAPTADPTPRDLDQGSSGAAHASMATAYLIVLVAMISFMSTFMTNSIMPTLRELGNEFEIQEELSFSSGLYHVVLASYWMSWVCYAILVWFLASVLLVYIAPMLVSPGALLGRCLGWLYRWVGGAFAFYHAENFRAEVLEGLTWVTRHGVSAADGVQKMLPLANHPTVHCLLRRCKPLLDQGQSLSHAMHAAGIINVAQRQQLEAAIPNGRASRCLEQIRRQQLRSAARRQRWLRVLVLPTV